MDPLPAVPLAFQRLAALIEFAEAAFLISLISRVTERAALQADLSEEARRRVPTLVGGFLAVWFAVALILGNSSSFPLEREGLRPLFSGLVVLVPFLAAILWLFASRTGRAIGAAIEPGSLIFMQFYRVAGSIFLYPFLAYGALPRLFALPAGIGDMLTGLMAPLVAWSVLRKGQGSYGKAVAWNIFGILDLIVAPAAAVFSGARVIQMFPLSLVPLFLGPPLGILIHISSLRNLSLNRRRLEQGEGSEIPEAAVAPGASSRSRRLC
jgi:hypothetical protein